MASNEWISMSQAECDAVARDALAAAHACFLGDHAYESPDDPQLLVRHVLQAFAAVKQVEDAAVRAKEAQHPGLNVHRAWVDAYHIVASALEFMDVDAKDIHPYTQTGLKYCAFARAARMLNAFGDLAILMEGPDMSGENFGAEVLGLLPPAQPT